MAAKAQRNGTAVIAGSNELQPLNPLVATEAWTLELLNHALFLPLVGYDRELRVTPALAESWRMVSDSVVEFRLRPDVRWHDGRATTSADVVFTFERMKEPKTAFPRAEAFERWHTARAVDARTVRFSFQPHPDALADWVRMPIAPKHLLDSIAPERMREAAFNHRPVGNGPFRFLEHRANDRWVFAANTDFAPSLGGRPRLDRLVYRIIPENSAQYSEALTGGADVLFGIRAEQARELDARRELRTLLRPSTRYLMITWNGKRAPFGDAAVRRALTMALNRPRMIQVLRSGYATLATGPIAPMHWAYDKSLKPLPYNADAARAVLTRAGFSATNPLRIELKIPANNAFNRDLAEMIRADLANVGVQVTVRAVEFATLIQDITSKERNFDAAILTLDSELGLNLREVFHSEALSGPYQTQSYSNPEVDRLIDAARAAPDRTTALEAYHRLQRILLEEQPLTFLWYAPDIVVVNERLKGVEMDLRGPLATVRQWRVER